MPTVAMVLATLFAAVIIGCPFTWGAAAAATGMTTNATRIAAAKFLLYTLEFPISNDLILARNATIEALFEPDVVSRSPMTFVAFDFPGMSEFLYGAVSSPAINIQNMTLTSAQAIGNSVLVNGTCEVVSYNSLGDIYGGSYLSGVNLNITFSSNSLIKFLELDYPPLSVNTDGANVTDYATTNQTELSSTVCSQMMGGGPPFVDATGALASVAPGNGTCSNVTYAGKYKDFKDCLTFMNSIELGNSQNLVDNTTYCRSYHAALSALSDNHCAHAGRTGGGKCLTPSANVWTAPLDNLSPKTVFAVTA